MSFAEEYGHYTVGQIKRMNRKSTMNKINWKEVIYTGVTLGFMASVIYLLLTITATLTA